MPLLLLLLLSLPASVDPAVAPASLPSSQPGPRLRLELTVARNGDVAVMQTVQGLASSDHYAQLIEPGLIGGLLQRRLLGPEAATADGRAPSVRQLASTGTVALTVAPWPGDDVRLRYTITQLARGGRIEFLAQKGGGPAWAGIEVALHLPAEDPTASLNLRDFGGLQGSTRRDGASLYWRSENGLDADGLIEIDARFSPEGFAFELGPSLRAFAVDTLPWAFILLALWIAAAVALGFGARTQLAVLHASHALVVVLFMAGTWSAVRFDRAVIALFPKRYEDIVYSSVVLGLVALVFSSFVAWQSLGLAQRRRGAHMELITTALVLAPILSFTPVHPLFALIPFAAATGLLFQGSHKLKLELGALTDVWVDAVRQHGEVRVEDLCRELRVSEKTLQRVLAREPQLPIVNDRQARKLYSPEVAAQKDALQICASCGGAVVGAGHALVVCPYCERSYATSLAAPLPKRPPLIVAAMSELVLAAGVGLAIFLGTVFAAFMIVDALLGAASFGGAELVGVLVMVALPLGVAAWASTSLTDGQHLWLVRVPLLLTSPLVVPALVLRAVQRPIVQLHFGALDKATLIAELERRGTWPLSELAQHLRAGFDEAASVAQTIALRDALAVYDRRGGRLVSRSLFSTLADARSCGNCGGLYGLSGPKLVCQHCGHAK